MTDSISRIQILDPERFLAVITAETQAGRRDKFALALLNLLETQASFIHNSTVHEVGSRAVGTIVPGYQELNELSWGIIKNPDIHGFMGRQGRHIINGGLIRHSDGTWGSHT